MLIRATAALLLLSSMASAQQYLPQTSAAAAATRSQQMCAAAKCDGQFTKYWWPVQPLTDGTASIVIIPGTSFDQMWDRMGACATCALTPAEKSAVVPASSLGTKLPWVLTSAAFQARFTPPQISAANASVDTKVSTEWATVKSAMTVNLTDPAVVAMTNAMVQDGIITAANQNTILTPVTVAAVPN